MPFDAEAPMTTTSHKAAALTAASALAMYRAAATAPDKLRAAAAMAEVLARLEAPKPRKAKAAPSDLLSAETLAAALKRVCAVVERRMTIPILTHVLLKAEGGRLTLTGTDLDMEYSESLRGDIGDFCLAVPARDLAKTLKGCTGEIVLADVTDDIGRALRLEAGGATAYFRARAAADFPTMEVTGAPYTGTMPASHILEPLRFVEAAISAEETRYYLNGAYMQVVTENGRRQLAFTATDGVQLRHERAEDDGGLPLDTPNLILPRKLVAWVLKNIIDDEVQVDVWPNMVRLTTCTGTVTSKVIDGNYPDYVRCIPRELGTTILGITDPKAFAATVARMAAQTGEKYPSLRLEIAADLGEPALKASARNMEGGHISANLPDVKTQADRSREFGFNARRLGDTVACGGAVDIHLAGPDDAVRFVWADKPERVAVLMPLRV